jgi:hypothetical protein
VPPCLIKTFGSQSLDVGVKIRRVPQRGCSISGGAWAVFLAKVMLAAVVSYICSSKAARRPSIALMTRREKGPRCA